MSLSSALLKHLFIHRIAHIPWSDITISAWPAPHKRPYWSPPASWAGNFGLEFNVSHQAGLTVLMGCRTPDRDSSSQPQDVLSTTNAAECGGAPETTSPKPRIGVDVTCTSEPGRRPQRITNDAELGKWVDIFTEMFSARERDQIRHDPFPLHSQSVLAEDRIEAKLRRFYTYWSLKEAYIKMVGEGLLAKWLRELEFRAVVSPRPVPKAEEDEWEWGFEDPVTHATRNDAALLTYLHGQRIENVKIELDAYQDIFIIASAIRGVTDQPDHTRQKWIRIDLERDIGPCVEGRCDCLSQPV